mgnify:CR=1 FL=1
MATDFRVAHLWDEAEAQRLAGAMADAPDMALRVYSARLIGSEPDLVMHGGGNVSLKSTAQDVLGAEHEVLHIKGSGWDLATIEAPGLPAVRLAPLRALRALDRLSDEDMVDIQRANLMTQSSPNPSVETLLHAYLPAQIVDHTHAAAFLALANLPEAEAACAEIFGPRLAVVPYIMPGFALARRAAEIAEAHPGAEGLLLRNHGHFTWGADARESYDRVIAHTNAVADWLAERRPGRLHPAAPAPDPAPPLAELRGAIAEAAGADAPMPVMEVRGDEHLRAVLERADIGDLATRGVATPDHVIRTKGSPLLLDRSVQAGGRVAIMREVADYADRYRAYFEAGNARHGGTKTMLSPVPNLAWLPGTGLVALGRDARGASVIADIAEQSARVIAAGEDAGGFRPIAAADLFDMEYWSLEQAKLGKGAPAPLAGRVVLVTGAAGAIGRAIAGEFAGLGAAVMLTDRDAASLADAAAALGPGHASLAADVTAEGTAAQLVEACEARFGGLDILVSNAGAAMTGELADLPDATLRESFELNFFAHQALAQAAAGIFRRQGRGGQMLFNVSKQAVNPGHGFGAYGLPKAATFFLVRQLALELGGEGVRVNGVNADRIRSGLLTDGMIAARAAARKTDAAGYLAGNLLGREVEAHHVARAFAMLAGAERTTGHVMTVDGGNTAAALR